MNLKNSLAKFFLFDLIYMSFFYAKYLFSKKDKLILNDIPYLNEEDTADACKNEFNKNA